MPNFYDFEQTNFCNMACPGCSNRLNLRPKGVMSPGLFSEILRQIDRVDRKKRIALHGLGEPLISPHLWKNLAALDAAGFKKVDLSTNGMMLDASFIKKLCTFKCLSWIRVSLNSSRREIAKQLYGDRYDFDLVVDNIRLLLDAKPRFKVVVQQFDTADNAERCEDMHRLIGRSDFTVLRKRYHDFLHLVDKTDLMVGVSHKKCVFGADSLFVHWDGDIVGCCTDDTKLQVIGNVADGIFSAKIQNRIFAMREQLAARDFSGLPTCKGCLNG